ncbi:5-(carboxyamino)imidazole ribonucleotide synthase [Pelagibaculum spongiae]|uniref:N5-carboxyaminoimidazole ribonucleotide synthase n=1 Tax=Pelagibaculum spongiae TaxID=2080658 RepID=A0A2V1GX05_9GAMM|nr:5-(carboxyamino)imidazole ribonucleotide synthase [Pelagibaculum spongiae]PVZ65457.1 5-(carboxyamino)imidazole ribonucleotide synthase [Pelagibaculum spongiae]
MKIGILGAGQLGRMMALAGIPLEHEFYFYGNPASAPAAVAGQVFDEKDPSALDAFIKASDVISYESENINAELVQNIELKKPVFPSVKSLRFSQHRLTEKNLFRELNIPVADFYKVESLEELKGAIAQLGLPIVLKTTTMGYDGKGQAVIKTAADIGPAWQQLKGNQLIAEAFVNFQRELSIIAARNAKGEHVFYPLAENSHRDGILRLTQVPAPGVSQQLQQLAEQHICSLLDQLDHVGILTLELFDTGLEGDQALIANEMAPRVHNSGHWSQQGAETCQFENHIRAISGLPLGATNCRHPLAAMINIIGKKGDKNLVLSEPAAHLHLYGKSERANRKLGHINLVADDATHMQQLISKFDGFMQECGE